MTLLEHIPAIIKMIMIFFLVLICIRKKLSLGNAFLLGSLFLSILFGLNPQATITSIFASITDPKTLSIAVVVSLILVLSSSMELAGQMQRMLKNFQGLVASPRLNLVIFPALIGLLPMPGGAVFSAPMVKELGVRSKLSEAQLSFVNYWFRHIWEHWWPLYPGILLTTVITEISLLAIIVIMCPFTAAAVWLGYRALKGPDSLPIGNRSGFKTSDQVQGQGAGRSGKRSIHRHVSIYRRSATQPLGLRWDFETTSGKNPRSPLWPFIKELVPILLVIFPGLGMGVLFSKLFPTFSISKEIGLILALCMAIAWVWYQNGTSKKQILSTLTNPQLLKMMYMIAGILIFKGILTDSHAAAAVSQELIQMHIPLVLIAVTLPLLVGMSGGIVIAFVGSTLPILVPMIQSIGEAQFLPAYVMLILVSGFTGVMLSPMHLCFLLSNEYFGVTPGSVYRYLWKPCVALVAAGMVYFWILHWLWRWM
jgi:hypothetical protein